MNWSGGEAGVSGTVYLVVALCLGERIVCLVLVRLTAINSHRSHACFLLLYLMLSHAVRL